MSERQKRALRVCGRIVFGAYLILLLYFLFFAESMGRTGAERAYHYNLVLLKEIKRFIVHRDSIGSMAVTLNLAGNVVAFVPFGLMVPAMREKSRSLWRMALWTFQLSLMVEVVQLVFKVGSFDVDDMLLNTVGGVLGYLMFAVLRKRRLCQDGSKLAQEKRDGKAP